MFIDAIAAVLDLFTAAIEAQAEEVLAFDMSCLHLYETPASERAPTTVAVFGTVMTKKERNRMVRDARKLGVRTLF